MSKKLLLYEYAVKNNDLSIPASRCHELLSTPSLPLQQRCQAALACARSLPALITTGDFGEKERRVAEVEKCVERRLAHYAQHFERDCALAAAYIDCAKEVAASTVVWLLRLVSSAAPSY
ncbi:MAG: hypothetical protein ACP5J0_03795 [Pyrobaculum sp.]